MGVGRILNLFGRILIFFGILLLLFVVYLLWGTGVSEHRNQDTLRRQFESELLQSKSHYHHRSATTTTTSTLVSPAELAMLTAGGAPQDAKPIAIIQIPKISIDDVVVEGTETADLKLGPGHYSGTAMPGQPGNAAIAGHRTTYGAPFDNLDQLSTGDEIFLTTLQGRFDYRVRAITVVSPTDVAVLDKSSTPRLTLTTCYPRYSASQRLVVQAALAESSRLAPTLTPGGRKSQARQPRELAGQRAGHFSAVVWGLLCVALVAFALAAAHPRARRRDRMVVYVVFVVPLLFTLYFFFENITPLLPASF